MKHPRTAVRVFLLTGLGLFMNTPTIAPPSVASVPTTSSSPEQGAPAAAVAPRLFVIVDNEKYGYIDRSGTVVIPPQFDYAEDFVDDQAVVRNVNAYGYIDRSGKIVIPLRFVEAKGFNGGWQKLPRSWKDAARKVLLIREERK